MKRTAADLLYLRLKRVFGGRFRERQRDPEDTEAFTSGRDPKPLGDALNLLTNERGWQAPLDRATIVSRWSDTVGKDVALHTQPELHDDELVVRCSSTAWAMNLRMMRSELLGKIREAHPGVEIARITFRGPDAPNWKSGPRSTPGRGPRDTYG